MVKKGFKYFIGYKDANKTRPLCIFLPKKVDIKETFMNKCIHFLIKDDELLKKYNEAKNSIKKIW